MPLPSLPRSSPPCCSPPPSPPPLSSSPVLGPSPRSPSPPLGELRKLLISNTEPKTGAEKQLLPKDETGAIARRFDIIHIQQKTYYEPGRPLPGWERPVARQASPLTGDRPFVAPRGLHTPQQPVRQFSPLVPPPAALRAAFGSQ